MVNGFSLFCVRIEFNRIQRLLTAIPRLREMVGANVLIGEAIRVRLPTLAATIRGGEDAAPWPDPAMTQPLDFTPPTSWPDLSGDPLTRRNDEHGDDPAAQYRQGLLARDGGHFATVFAEAAQAERFLAEAQALLARDVPGLSFTGRIVAVPTGQILSHSAAAEQMLPDLPQIQACDLFGNGPASSLSGGEARSSAAARRTEKGRDFHRGKPTFDVIGLMRDALPSYRAAQDFHQLCGGDYLAVIVADGNAVGAGKPQGKTAADKALTDWLSDEASVERYFFSVRSAVRQAVCRAANAVLTPEKTGTEVQPFQLLMLGGDDILMVCRAKLALPFAVELARALTALPRTNGEPLTLGIGVAIARASVPFHHLHRVADELAASAKRLYRGLAKPASTIDWQVSTASWADDLRTARRRDSVVRTGAETLLLSRRPYRVLADAESPSLDMLEGLLGAVDRLGRGDQAVAARSQLLWLADALAAGRRAGALAFHELPADTRAALKRAGIEEPWLTVSEPDHVWTTAVPDLVGLTEISSLRSAPRSATSTGGGEEGEP